MSYHQSEQWTLFNIIGKNIKIFKFRCFLEFLFIGSKKKIPSFFSRAIILKIPLPFYKFNRSSRSVFTAHLSIDSNRKIGIRDCEIFENRIEFCAAKVDTLLERPARDGHGRRIDISFSGTTRNSVFVASSSEERSHSDQLKSDRGDGARIDVHAFLASCPPCLLFLPRRKGKKPLREKREFSTREAYVNFRR